MTTLADKARDAEIERLQEQVVALRNAVLNADTVLCTASLTLGNALADGAIKNVGRGAYESRLTGTHGRMIDAIRDTRQALAPYGLAMAGHLKPRAPSENQHRYRSNVEHKVKLLLKGAKRRAENRGFEYELDWDWVHSQLEKQKYKCALTGIAFEWKDKFYGPSIDRIDSSIGYTKRNTRIVLVCVNVMLSDWGEHVLARISRAYVKHNKVPVDD